MEGEMAASYEIKTRRNPRYTSLELTGEVGSGMAARLAKDVMEIFANDTAIKVLVDVRRLTVRVDPVETIHLVSSYKDMNPRPRPSKTAVLYEKEHHDVLRFYETVALNRGYSTAIFTDRSEAEKWLEI
jgi:hypothetical protein